MGGIANRDGSRRGSFSVKKDFLQDRNPAPAPGQTHAQGPVSGRSVSGAGACWGRSGGLSLSFITAPAALAQKHSGLGKYLSIQYLPCSSGRFHSPAGAHPSLQPAQVCVHKRPPTSAGRSLARLQRGPLLPSLGDSPKTPWQHPEGTATSPSHPQIPLQGVPRSWGTSVATPAPSSSPTALSPWHLPLTSAPSAFITQRRWKYSRDREQLLLPPGKSGGAE